MKEDQEFRITLDEDESRSELMFEAGVGEKIWRWVSSETEKILNLSMNGITASADKIKKQLEAKLGGTWLVSEISLTISSNPSATVTIVRKTQEV
jgi:hypothetical protein